MHAPLRNPDFDDDRVIWDDAYSGTYQPVPYDEQFDLQWKLFLDRQVGFYHHTGVETKDEYIDDRIVEITGARDYLLTKRWGALAPMVSLLTGRRLRQRRRGIGGITYYDLKFSIDFFRNKHCLDIACGAGRWTKTMVSLGAKVTSIDMSDHALKSTARFTPNTEKLDLFSLPDRADMRGKFDFVLAWGVLMHTHDPKLAFASAASAVKPGGAFYFCVYVPAYHASQFVRTIRRRYHRELRTPEERMAYVYEICGDKPEMAITYLDNMNTFYNWTIEADTIRGWCAQNGFTDPVFINQSEPEKCQHHVLTWKR
jgi:2-polyprenyl-3-methyl-5-hydroxy-6-metoxy-1,4-benzoquinol methylase